MVHAPGVPRVRHNFGEPGIWLTWDDGCWIHEVRLVPLESETVAFEERHRPRHRHAVPPGGISSAHRRGMLERVQWEALAQLRELLERAPPSQRFHLELAGFTRRNVFRPIRPRNPRTPDLLLAAVAALWEEEPSRAKLAKRLGYSPEWVKAKVRLARERGFLDGAHATAEARRLLKRDGRSPKEIIAGRDR